MKKFSNNINSINNSEFFRKYSNLDLNLESENPLNELSEKQLIKQSELLTFLRDTTIKQSETAEKQSRNNLIMTILALVFAFISIIPIIKEWIYPNQTKKIYQNIYELESKLLLESKHNLEMYNNLLDLENQVKILEKQNELLLKENILKK